MSANPNDQDKIEQYARALIEAGRAEGRSDADLVQWRHAQKFSPEVLEVLGSMRQSDDLHLVDAVSKEYKEILDAGDDTVMVTVTTSVPMDDDLRAKVKAKASADLGAPVYLVERVDPSILGGIILEQRGKRYDASVRAQLSNIRKSLSGTFIGVENDE
ncbi:MAG: F0F1 ATP synthase subunit delta [Olegusella sp.]|nr:F0F1 ATP synthase subunit delta [Olegusella sp.]